MAALGRLVPRLARLEHLARVVVGHVCPLGLVLRRQHDDGDFSELGRAEQRLALVEIACQRFGRWLADLAGLRRAKLHVVDRTLFVAIALQRVEQRLRRLDAAAERRLDLLAHRQLALFGDETLLGITHLANDLRKTLRIELARHAREGGSV